MDALESEFQKQLALYEFIKKAEEEELAPIPNLFETLISNLEDHSKIIVSIILVIYITCAVILFFKERIFEKLYYYLFSFAEYCNVLINKFR